MSTPYQHNTNIWEIFKFTISNTKMHKICHILWQNVDRRHTNTMSLINHSTVYTNVLSNILKSIPHNSTIQTYGKSLNSQFQIPRCIKYAKISLNTFIVWNSFLYFVLPETIVYTVFFKWSFNSVYNFC